MIFAQCIHDITTSYGLVLSMFLAGLVGGATHCVGMCAPFVLAQVGEDQKIQRLGSFLLLPYHLGRMTTYVMLAVLLNSVVNLAFLFSDTKTFIAVPMLVLAGVIFLVSAFPRLSIVFPWISNIRVSMPYTVISRFSARLMKNSGVVGRYGLGVLLGFMPCGLVISAVMASASAPTVLQAGFAMTAFTVGTMPALIMVAFGGHALRFKYPTVAKRISQGAMIASGLWLFALAGTMVL